MKIEHLKTYGAVSELKELNDYLDKRISFHKGVSKLLTDEQENTKHLLICIELYDIKDFLYNRILEVTKDLNLNEQDPSV